MLNKMPSKLKKQRKYKGFTTKEIENYTGVSARKLRWWDQQGLVKPGKSPGRNPLQTRRYTLQDMVCILVVKSLREKGLSLQKIRESVERVQITGVEHPLAKLRVACLANSVFFKRDGKYFEPISGQMVIEEALDEIRPRLKPRQFGPINRIVKNGSKHFKEKVGAF